MNAVIHCPLCGEKIDYLKQYAQVEALYHYTGNGDSEYVDTFYDAVRDEYDFECPECSEVLFHDEEIANKFMQMGDLFPWEALTDVRDKEKKGVDDYG
jgi:predicted RNA-binding Zn-ribbon protein involved in translation (DUF1610 family)